MKAHKRLNDELIGPNTKQNWYENSSPIKKGALLANPNERKAKKIIRDEWDPYQSGLFASPSPHLIL